MPIIKVTLSIGFVNSFHEDYLEVSEEEWLECETDEEREKLINDYWKDWANNYIDGGSVLLDDDGNPVDSDSE